MNSLTFELRNVRRTALVLSLILPIGTLMAQGGETPRVLDTKVVESPVFKVEKLATVRFSDLKDDWNPVLKTIRTVHTPGVNARKDELIRLKAEANAERDRYLATLPGAAEAEKVSATTPPTLPFKPRCFKSLQHKLISGKCSRYIA